MQIINETQLDFSDVLIKPRRSSIDSRSKVDITREYKFKWCPYVIKGTGIMQANMGTIGNFEVSKKMLDYGLFACLHKHHNIEDLISFYKKLHHTYIVQQYGALKIPLQFYCRLPALYQSYEFPRTS